ncbi:hypothetical protein CK203_092170 [Vitis vinifera]|uniref:Uncharacterized protein n=1 Tax=Vitis vinifera TaxID=29760 RepID=A0A438DG13_VITVI|nr:hypothetical protein CK203_092170 [Vitis vinifera]
MQGQELGRNSQGDSWERVSQIRDKFEYDRERRMREKGIHHTPILGKEPLRMVWKPHGNGTVDGAFAPMTGGMAPGSHQSVSRNQRFDTQRYFSQSESE